MLPYSGKHHDGAASGAGKHHGLDPGTNKTGKFEHVKDRDNLALEEVTIAEVLKENGYKTFFAGKWHLGSEGHYPEDQGFDINIGGHQRGGPPGGYYAPWNNPKLEGKADGEYLTERLTEETNAFIKKQAEEQEPFLAYLSYYNVHTPIQAYKKRIAEYEERASALKGPTPTIAMRDGLSRARQDNPALGSMVAAVDDSLGSVLENLEKLGLHENTVVIFFSDNGGLCTRPYDGKKHKAKARIGPGCNLPLRSGKGWFTKAGSARRPSSVHRVFQGQGIAIPQLLAWISSQPCLNWRGFVPNRISTRTGRVWWVCSKPRS